MGLFRKKQEPQITPEEAAAANEGRFLDENFREELRNHGRWYFEKIIRENGELFKKDLDATVAHLNTALKEQLTAQLNTAVSELTSELRERATTQLDAELVEYRRVMKEAQDTALGSLTSSTQALQEQYRQLSDTLQHSVVEQEAAFEQSFKENKTRLAAMHDTQERALQWLNQSAQALEKQHQDMVAMLQKNVTEQEKVLVDAFEQNMAKIIEHYLLGALGDQYDLKAQLPAIIRQMEENKKAIVDDMQL